MILPLTSMRTRALSGIEVPNGAPGPSSVNMLMATALSSTPVYTPIPTKRPSARARACSWRKRRITGQLKRHVQSAFVVAAIVSRAVGGLVGKLFGTK